ncbi:MAG: Spy/CpxP family protein refolding chaperone [Polyangia bacterium]
MKSSRWLVVALVVLLAVSVALAGWVASLGSRLEKTGSRLEHLEARIADLFHPDGAARSAAERVSELSERLAEMKKSRSELIDRIDAVLLKMRANSRRLDAIEAGDLEDLGIEELVDRKLVETVQRARMGKGNRKRPPVEQLAQYLELTPAQQQRIRDTIDAAKDDLLELMRAERRDGSTLGSDLAAVMRSKADPEAKRKAVMSELFGKSPPGTNESYFTRIMDLRAESLDEFYQVLDDSQYEKFRSLGVDPFAVQTGYSPFRDLAEGTAEER